LNSKEFGFCNLPLDTDPVIDDTTLRDGVQMPGLAAAPKDAAEIARLLDEIGVERIEVFHYQKTDKQAVKLMQKMGLSASIAGWCRAVKEDVDDALDCGFKDIGISHPVSYIHFNAKWPEKTPDELLNRVVELVEYAEGPRAEGLRPRRRQHEGGLELRKKVHQRCRRRRSRVLQDMRHRRHRAVF